MEIDRRAFIASLGGAAAIEAMSSEAKADALEHYMMHSLDVAVVGEAAVGGEASAVIADPVEPPRTIRRGAGTLFGAGGPGGGGNSGEARSGLKPLAAMPDKPTLVDFFNLRFQPATHVLQSATDAMRKGEDEEMILSCLLHDVVLNLIKVDHGWWGSQMLEPYVSEKVSWGIRYHQCLRFYPDESVGYHYPELYNRIFGKDYVPQPHIKAAYDYARNNKNYMRARMITVHDLYAFDPTMKGVSLDPFIDIIGRHFKQPKEGLGNDNSPVAHMWRSMRYPDNPL